MNRAFPLPRLLVSALVLALGARVFAACSSESAGLTNVQPEFDAGVDGGGRQPCDRTAACTALNEVCIRRDGVNGFCEPPSGSCQPEAPIEGQCYPDARCDLSAVTPDGRGRCSFQPPSRAVFPLDTRITLEAPTQDTEIFPTTGFSFRWQPLRDGAGAVTVAMVSRQPPSFDPARGRISNWASVVWAWSSAQPGNTAGDGRAVDGTVPVRFGHRGVSRDGAFGPPWDADTLPAGQYWWFVYSIRGGTVVATSVAQAFYVGALPARPQRCAVSTDCVLPGDLPELFECYATQCRRRCASDVDCRAQGTRCAFDGRVMLLGDVRRGAFCEAVVSPMDRDGGSPVDAPR